MMNRTKEYHADMTRPSGALFLQGIQVASRTLLKQTAATVAIAEEPEPERLESRPPLFRAKKRWRLIVGVLCCAVLVAAGGMFLRLHGTQQPDVTLYRVGTMRVVSEAIGGGGLVYPQQQIDLSYPATERILSVPIKPGDHVRVNQTLLKLDPAQLSVSIQQANADVQAAQAYLDSVAQSGNAVTQAQAEQAYQLAKNRYAALVAQGSSGLLHNGDLISPIDGVVTTVNVSPGEIVAGNTDLITIMDMTNVVVHAKIPLEYLDQVTLGQKAQVTPSALSARVFEGTVSSIIPQADPQTDTFEIWITIPNKGMKLLPGMSAFAHVQSTLEAFALPRLAVLSPEEEAAVFTVHDQTAHMLPVQVVGRTVDTIYVIGELQPGDEIILVGIHDVHDGQHVRITRIEG